MADRNIKTVKFAGGPLNQKNWLNEMLPAGYCETKDEPIKDIDGNDCCGWRGRAFPVFSFLEPKLLHVLCCSAVDSIGFTILARTSEEAKEVLEPVLASRYEEANRKPAPPPEEFFEEGSWGVYEVISDIPQVLSCSNPSLGFCPSLGRLKEVSEQALNGYFEKPCEYCGKSLLVPEEMRYHYDDRQVKLIYFTSTIGDGISVQCLHCGECSLVTECDF